MIVSIHQPNYLPWGGYFFKIINSDLFIFLDDVQFSKNSFINRTKVTHNNEYTWLSIPIKFNLGESILQVKLAQEDWQLRHLSKIQNMNYVMLSSCCGRHVVLVTIVVVIFVFWGNLCTKSTIFTVIFFLFQIYQVHRLA